MANRPKFGKISIVVFLTILIWVWADLAQDETLTLPGFFTISVTKSSDPTLWISFVEGPDQTPRASVTLDNVDLRGPASRVAEVERTKNKERLDPVLFLDPVQESFDDSGTRTLDVLNFLKRSVEIGQLGLTVESCEPRTLTIQVRQLEKKFLPVVCVDLNGTPVRGASVAPPQVETYVPPDVVYVAKIQLTEADQRQARVAEIERMPYVDFALGQRREIPTKVKITLASEQVALAENAVPATLGFCFSTILQGKYEVELQNEAELQSVFVKATPAALEAYKQQRFKIFLYILDDDRQATDWIPRAVEFNFPEDFVRSREIEEGEGGAPTALFRVVPISVDAEENF